MRHAVVVLMFALSCHAFDAAKILPFVDMQLDVGSAWYLGLGLDSAWSIDEGSGTNAVDYIGNKNGWQIGSPSWSTRAGITCLALNGTSQSIGFGDIYDIGTNSLMVSAWVFLDTGVELTDVAGIIGKPIYGGAVGRYSLYAAGSYPGTTIYFMYQASGGGITATCPNATTGVWCMVSGLIARDTATVSLYTNGVMCSSSSGVDDKSLLDVTVPFSIGVYDVVSKNIAGSVRNACFKYNGTASDIEAVWQRTRGMFNH